jgi:hypothetical protein
MIFIAVPGASSQIMMPTISLSIFNYFALAAIISGDPGSFSPTSRNVTLDIA